MRLAITIHNIYIVDLVNRTIVFQYNYFHLDTWITKEKGSCLERHAYYNH